MGTASFEHCNQGSVGLGEGITKRPCSPPRGSQPLTALLLACSETHSVRRALGPGGRGPRVQLVQTLHFI